MSNERDPTEEMVLAGIAAANRTMPYVSDAQCVAAIWKAMQAANSQVMPHGVEGDAIEKALRQAFNLGQTYWQQADSESYSQNRKSYDTLQKFNALLVETSNKFSGKAIVPVDAISKALHGLEHLKADIQERSKSQEDYQEGVVMVGAGAWHALCSAILMLAAAKEQGND